MQDFSLETLEQFIVRAKQSTYVGSGEESQPSRLKSHDLQFAEGPLWISHSKKQKAF